MQGQGGYEKYPAGIVVMSNLVSLLVYGTGVVILSGYGLFWVIIYVLYILLLEFRLLSRHCVDCYYYGKTCAFGKGYLSSLLFDRGRPEKFNQKQITWKDMVPDFLVFILPVLAGIGLLAQVFSWFILSLTIALLFLGFFGNAFVRGKLACRHCKQRDIGCPADQLFDKTTR